MRRLVAVVASIAAALAAIAACGSFESTPTPATDDASTTGEASTIDGAPAVAFCKENAGSLCEDFDDPGSGALPLPDIDTGGTLTVVDEPHASPPKALRATFALQQDTSCHYAARRSQFFEVPAPNGFRVEYKLLIPKNVGKLFLGGEVVDESDVDGGPPGCSYYLTAQGAALKLALEPTGDFAATQYINLSRVLQVGAWSTVSIDVHGAAGSRAVTVFIDGVAAVEDFAVDPLCQSGTRLVQAAIGLICVNATALEAVDISFDDLRVIVH